jgi:outer membrane protein assembly factor BamB
MSFATWLKAGTCAVILGAVVGCNRPRLHLSRDPFDVKPSGLKTSGRPPVALYAIEWWVPLVLPPAWEYLPREPAPPAADPEGGRIIVLTRDKMVRAITVDGHQIEWSFATRGGFTAAALVSDGVVYVPGGDGILYALQADSGQLLWTYDVGEPLIATPAVALGKVLAASENDAIVAVDAKTGKLEWRYRREVAPGFTIRGGAAPRVDGELAYVGFSDGYLVALAIGNGTVKWERALSTPGKQFLDVDTTPVLDGLGRVFAASYKDGIYALESESGSIHWHTARPGVTNLILKGAMLFAAGDQEVEALVEESGRPVWSYDLGTKAANAPVLAQGVLVVPTGQSLIFLDATSGKPRSFWNPGKGVTATPLWDRSRLYVLSNLGYLYAMRFIDRGATPGK